MTRRILHVVTNVAHYADPDEPTGLWLSELTHACDLFEAEGYEQRIVSPKERDVAARAAMAAPRRLDEGVAG